MNLWREPAFKSWVEAMDDLVLTLDRDGRITGSHCPDPRLLAGKKDLEGQLYSDVLPAEVAQAFRVGLQALESTGRPQRLNYQITIDEVRRHYTAKLCHLSGTDATLLVAWDVTEHALGQYARLESEAFYRLLAENSSDVISVKDVDGRYIYVSPSVTKLVGQPVEALIGQQLADFWHPDDVARLRARQKDFAPPESGARIRHRVQHKAGHWVWVESDVRMFEWRGRPAVLCASRDITRRQQAEEHAAVMLEELKEARSRAESANVAKSEVLTNMSHELRTPLHGILGMAELLGQTHLSEEQQQYLAAIRDSGEVLLALINDTQDLSKIEAGQLDLQEQDFDLVEAVEGLADIVGSEAAARGIELTCQVAIDVPTGVRGDPQRLRQVLISLINTAVRLAERGRVDVRVRLLEGDLLRFSVEDSAPGVSQAAIEELFGPPTPSGGLSLVRPAGGVTLGLTIARKLVALMGGQLQARAEAGAGSTLFFDLRLPLATRATQTLRGEELQGLRLLVTDSSPSSRQWLREVLEQGGAEVDQASGGVELVQALRDDPSYQCAIIDASLPDLDGVSTVAVIRANPSLAALKLLLTASPEQAERLTRWEDLGANGLLLRPLRREVLVRAVREVITTGRVCGDERQLVDGTVLVVEDNLLNLRLARDFLRRAGYRVVGARDAGEALQLLERHTIDAVLMDIQLPDMDGLEATARIRERPAWGHIPIIAMTAHAMKGDAERFLHAGLDAYLSKPVNRLELLRVVGREIASRAVAAKLSSARRGASPAAPP
jgi:PAS domain S-box-containing protein